MLLADDPSEWQTATFQLWVVDITRPLYPVTRRKAGPERITLWVIAAAFYKLDVLPVTQAKSANIMKENSVKCEADGTTKSGQS